jgi:hypothetical protein
MLTSDQILVMGIHFVSNEMMEMRYQCKEGFVEESGRTNVVIAGLYHSSSHHKNLVADQHVEIFGRFGYVFYLRHVGSLSEFSPKAIQHQFG